MSENPLDAKKIKKSYSKYISMHFLYRYLIPVAKANDVTNTSQVSILNNLYELFDYYAINKYSNNNFKEEVRGADLYLDSYTRHFEAFLVGEYYDPESSYPHLLHCLANINMLVKERFNVAEVSNEEKALIVDLTKHIVRSFSSLPEINLARRDFSFNNNIYNLSKE